MDKVVVLNMVTRLDLPAERVLEAAGRANLKSVVIAGYDDAGDEYFCSSIANGPEALWLLERMKYQLLKIVEETNDG